VSDRFIGDERVSWLIRRVFQRFLAEVETVEVVVVQEAYDLVCVSTVTLNIRPAYS
jgi:hypothetical protein